jgi:hypothetical protein
VAPPGRYRAVLDRGLFGGGAASKVDGEVNRERATLTEDERGPSMVISHGEGHPARAAGPVAPQRAVEEMSGAKPVRCAQEVEPPGWLR